MQQQSQADALATAQRVLTYLQTVLSAQVAVGPSEWAAALEAHRWLEDMQAGVALQAERAAPAAEPPPATVRATKKARKGKA